MSRPKVKPEHSPYRIANNRIRIGGTAYGLAAEIEDPAGWVWTMLTAMDGSRSLPQIIEHTRTAHPELTDATAHSAADQLLASGHLEDAAAAIPGTLTERDLIRHDRALGYFRWLDLTPRASSWEPQARLKDASVTILGVGGTGGIAAMALAASGVGRLHCVDPARVELSNLSRQILYTEDDIGTPKVEAAVARLNRLNSDITVTGSQSGVTGIGDVQALADHCDVLLLAADSPPEIRVWTNRACLAAKRPWVDSSYTGPLIETGAFVPGQGQCWECNRLHGIERSAGQTPVSPDETDPGRQAVYHAVGAAAAGLSGYLAAHRVIALIIGVPAPAPGRVEAINLAAPDAPLVFAYPPHPDCPACGPARLPR